MNYEQQSTANVWDAVGISVNDKPEFRSEMERELVRRWGAGTAKWQDGQCKICSAPIPNHRAVIEMQGQEVVFTYGCCDRCVPMRDAHYRKSATGEAERVSMTPLWDEQCPVLYKELLDDLPAKIDAKAFADVQAWPIQGKGMILSGASGAGKTTALWALFRELERKGTAPILLTGVELQRQLSEAARDVKGVKHLTHCRVLMVDDLGKEKLTASVAALLWEVVEARYANRRPLIISTRYAGEAFTDRFGDKILGTDIRRRLLDCCAVAQFHHAS
jgi:hypothetical protein